MAHLGERLREREWQVRVLLVSGRSLVGSPADDIHVLGLPVSPKETVQCSVQPTFFRHRWLGKQSLEPGSGSNARSQQRAQGRRGGAAFQYRGVVQLAARWVHGPEAAGSSPAPATRFSLEASKYVEKRILHQLWL